MLSDFVRNNTCSGAGRATDQRPFAAAGESADQCSAGSCASYGFGGVVMTPIMRVLSCFRPLVFALGYLLRPTVGQRPWLQDRCQQKDRSNLFPSTNLMHLGPSQT
jgi:hypothetical protein